MPLESYAQTKASPALLQSVSYDTDSESLLRFKENGREIAEQAQKETEAMFTRMTNQHNAILDNFFPEHISKEERDMALAAIYTDLDNPFKGWQSLYNETITNMETILAPALKALQEGMGQGTYFYEDQEGNTKCGTNNDTWYSQWYKEHKRPPTKAELRELARHITFAESGAPQVFGFVPQTQEEYEAMQENKPKYERLEKELDILQKIKDRMQKINKTEISLTTDLSGEAYSVYRDLFDKLSQGPNKTATRVAQMNAAIFARHADIFARIMREKQGTNYTAMDYYRHRFGFDLEGKYGQGNFAQKKFLTLQEESETFFFDMLSDEEKQQYEEAGTQFAENGAKVKDNYNGISPSDIIKICDTPILLQRLGIVEDTIEIVANDLHEDMLPFTAPQNHHHPHNISTDILREIPKKLCDPIMVFPSLSRNDRVVVVVDITAYSKHGTEGKIMLPIEISKNRAIKCQKYNRVHTLYPKSILELFADLKKAENLPGPKYISKKYESAVLDNNIQVKAPSLMSKNSSLIRKSISQEYSLVNGNTFHQHQTSPDKTLVAYHNISADQLRQVFVSPFRF